ncbi:alpha/beta hydrolase [Agarilytica rhodophyticola]|uniref:alpha/beta hydrolase n=1 Tax=Agarilytica rhodophyticola TaxID=1737490 RepID=UPI0013157DB4|nr:alpha/beta hydrolase [Agarilytica rhodophyticola]
MPNFKIDNKLTLDIIKAVEHKLPQFDSTSTVSFDDVDTDLDCYFQTYGFASMEAADKARYTLGFLKAVSHKVACHYWSVDQPKGTVFVAHGLFDHVGLYLDLIDLLVMDNYCVVAIDFPGHGLSEGEPAVIGSFTEYAVVIRDVLMALDSEISKPIYAIGQSTGSAALLNYVLAIEGEKFSKLILLAPLIQPRNWPMINIAYLILHKFVRFVGRSFTENSCRPGFCEFLKTHDPLQPRNISVEWIGAMRQWINRFDTFSTSKTETLIIQGDDDGTVGWEKNIPRIQLRFPFCQVKMLASAKHHLVNEGDEIRNPMFTKIIDFFNEA